MRKFLLLCLSIAFFAMSGYSQVMSISGKITDDKGEPVPFASVIIKGKEKSGTTADAKGSFTISASKGEVLVITGVNYQSKEVTISSASPLSITLFLTTQSLSEVVVTAMGIKRSERALGYTVAKVDPEVMLQKSESNVLNTLAGKVPGVDIRAGQGAPGAASRIQIRGVNSFNGSEPLIVVDGVPYSNPIVNTSNPFSGGGTYGSGINNIDPNDIADISVLKGAAAAALYGARASDGVLMITTKSGSPTKGAKPLNVTYRGGYSIEKVANIPTFQNSYGAGANFRTQSSNGSWGAKFGQGVIYNASGQVIGISASGVDSIPATTWATMYNAWPELFPNGRAAYKAYPNNVADLFKTGNMMEHSLGISGSQGSSMFNVTLSRTDQDGYITNSSYKKNNISIGGQTGIGNLTIGANMAYTRSTQVGGFIGAAQNFISQWGRTYTMARNWDIVGYPSTTRDGATQIGFNDGQYTNPVWGAYNNVITSVDDRMVANFRASYKFNTWLKADMSAGVNNYNLFRDQIIDKSSYGSADNLLGTLTEVVNRQQEINGKFIFTISPKISTDFSLTAHVGTEISHRESRNQQVYGVDFVVPKLFNLRNTRRQQFDSDSRSKRRLAGFFSDATIGYKNYAFLTASIRMDNSSTLPVNANQYFYPAVSASLVWTDMLGIKSDWLDYGKIRGGFARVGKDAGPYSIDPVFGFNALGFLGQPSATRGGTAFDPNLTPEFSNEFEVGTEARMFKGRIGLDVTYYNKTSTDIIYGIALPNTTGYSTFYTNIGKIENKGWEIGLNATPVSTRDFKWDFRGVFTQNKNTVLELYPGLIRTQLGGYNWAEAGMPYGYLRGSFSARADDGQLLINATSGMPFADPNPGMVGDPNPDFKFGLTNTFSYKGLHLSALFDATIGGDFYSESINGMLGRGVTKDTENREKNAVITGIYGNATPVTGADGLNHYVPIVDANGATMPNQTRVTTNDLFFTAGTGASFATNGAFEYSVFDGTVYRLRELSLGYTIPASISKKIHASSITLSLTGRNLWFLAPNVPKYTNFDPDMNSVVGSNTQGVETGGAPSAKRYGINLNVNF
ncbi:SusC/RagA family TonB-linked outer membrane protein [Terrimonas sp. NA20]|uniref:SusC/RagA family TonB-linked outer membrane protein n=1 Tax=Terrimonas ginsenosidimutans TaxID=2908004 RepID=A0ABS9KRN5_9BACT|nr:SusC/RagA family TonB-linked outer membrane protein [Terrimonas ginsenosidimutans]MCG2614957.1 SusC/RagA family TonB-linked outer membrane protein [Terrimonas ginsenosidimutans]